MADPCEVAVVGAGQAGLAVSHELTHAAVRHVVLERGRVGETWRGRWDSFCLVTPNWSVQLPGYAYDGVDPDGFMPRDEIVAMLERYAASFDAPVQEGLAVTALRRDVNGRFVLETSAGSLEVETVVLATGAYQRSHRPSGAATLPADLLQIDVKDYRNPDLLPSGAVLVVGSGQSGCQIAEELCEAGRDVVLACGRASWGPRRLGGRDLFWWLVESGALDDTVADLPGGPADRLLALVLATGRGGGHDINYRTLQKLGVTLVGHFRGADGYRARFEPDLAQTVAWSDERHAKLMDQFVKLAAERGIAVEIPKTEPFSADAHEEVDLSSFGAAVFTSGFRPDYESWVECPAAFDEYGFPVHDDGASKAAPGLYFVGVHFLRARKSSLLIGVGEDAAIVARKIAAERNAA